MTDSTPLRTGMDRFLLLATAVFIAAFLVRQVYDPDTFWQVAIGREILSTLAVPRTDHFAIASYGRPYHDSHWLFQVILALADRLGGMAGVGLAMAALWGGTFTFCYLACRRWLPVAASCLLVVLAAMACSLRFSPRPDIVTCFMIAAFYFLLQEGKYRTPGGLATLAILQVIWTNGHGLFVIGPFMVGCHLVGTALAKRDDDGSPDRRSAAMPLVLVLLATLVTPYGLAAWQYALLLFTEVGSRAPELFRNLEELAPTFGANSRSYPDFWFYLLLTAGAVATTLLAGRRREVPFGRILMVAALLLASASGKRNMPLFALSAAPLIAENLGCLLQRRLFPVAGQAVLAVLLLGATWLPVSGLYYRLINHSTGFGLGTATTNFPPGLIGFLKENDFKGTIYHGTYLGGYLLYNGIMPLVDGRWEVYDPATVTRIVYAPLQDADWEWLLKSYQIRGIALLHGSQETRAIIPRLLSDPRWQRVYEDSASSFWASTQAAAAP